MTVQRGRRIQSRRTAAMLTWAALAVLAVLLRYARMHSLIRGDVWEPAALLLTGFLTLLSLFCWLLFAPRRSSAEDSAALFFGGLLTLIPPAFIAWNLMPVSSPLKSWLTLGVLVFGVLAILSPIPEELFRVPRDRRSYLRLVTDATLATMDVGPEQTQFEKLAVRTVFRLTGGADAVPAETQSATVRGRRVTPPEEARDPWTDPFHGTGRTLSRVRSAISAAGTAVSHAAAALRGTPAVTATPAAPAVPPPIPVADSVASRFPLPQTSALQPSLQPAVTAAVPMKPAGTPSLQDLEQRLREEFGEEEGDAGDESAVGGGLSTAALISVQHSSDSVQMQRVQDEYGGENVEGTATVRFQIGQKRVHLHIPFSPPLPGIPDVECEPTGTDAVRVKVAMRQAYGVRLEVRRAEASQPLQTEISFAAAAAPVG
ncbi:MAG: hypothetical protein RIT02_2539 [Planctomycetota bacterium]|jgi:hypothetical protein